MNGKRYFLVFFNKARKSYIRVLLITLLILAVISAFALLILNSYENSSEKTRYKIGLVGNTKGGYLEVGIAAIKNLDSSRFSVDLVQTNEADAKNRVLSGEFEGYIRIPEHFEDDMSWGRETTVAYVSRQKTSTFGAAIIYEIAELVSDITLQSQSAVFTLGDIGQNISTGTRLSAMNNASIRYVTQAIGRNNMSETEILGISPGLSMGGYYLCAVLVILMLFWGISCLDILYKEDYSLRKILYRNDISAVKQTAGEYAVYLILSLVTFFAFFTAIGVLASVKDLPIEIFSGNIFDMWELFIGSIPVIILFTSMQFLIYELISSRIAAVILQFFITAALGYISGCFYPSYFFPEALQKFAEFLPVGAGFSYIKGVFGSRISGRAALFTVVYIILFAGASVLLRKRRLAGDKG